MPMMQTDIHPPKYRSKCETSGRATRHHGGVVLGEMPHAAQCRAVYADPTPLQAGNGLLSLAATRNATDTDKMLHGVAETWGNGNRSIDADIAEQTCFDEKGFFNTERSGPLTSRVLCCPFWRLPLPKSKQSRARESTISLWFSLARAPLCLGEGGEGIARQRCRDGMLRANGATCGRRAQHHEVFWRLAWWLMTGTHHHPHQFPPPPLDNCRHPIGRAHQPLSPTLRRRWNVHDLAPQCSLPTPPRRPDAQSRPCSCAARSPKDGDPHPHRRIDHANKFCRFARMSPPSGRVAG